MKKILIVVADKVKATEDVLKQMEADTTVSKEVKDKWIKEVLNGRWFSGKLDEHFGNSSLWAK